MNTPLYDNLADDKNDQLKKLQDLEMNHPNRFQMKALRLAKEAHNAFFHSEKTEDDFYVVWFCKVLQNWKALISTDVVSGVYYEVTYNGDRCEAYIDTYSKERNIAVSDFEKAPDISIHPTH